MSDSLHLVCPHCQAINRVPVARLDQQPNCGQYYCRRSAPAVEHAQPAPNSEIDDREDEEQAINRNPGEPGIRKAANSMPRAPRTMKNPAR